LQQIPKIKAMQNPKNKKEVEYITGSKLYEKNKKPSKKSKRAEQRTPFKTNETK
jgi:hypothetical protein